MTHAIDQEALQTLLRAQAIREARANRANGSWLLSVRLGAFWHPVRSKREPVRSWASLTALGKFCDTVGIKELSVEF
jgi:hypothetical protein